MRFSVSDEMNLFSQELQNYLSPSSLQQLAKEVGFVQRTTKYQAQELIALCVWLSQQVAGTPLTQLCSRLEASTGVLMSPERYSLYSVRTEELMNQFQPGWFFCHACHAVFLALP